MIIGTSTWFLLNDLLLLKFPLFCGITINVSIVSLKWYQMFHTMRLFEDGAKAYGLEMLNWCSGYCILIVRYSEWYTTDWT